MGKQELKTALIVLVSVLAGAYLAGGLGSSNRAYAQGEGQASGVICVVGQGYSGYAPIVLVDVPDQTLLVYEYSYGNNRIELTAARTFRYDRRLNEFGVNGPTVEEVRQAVLQQQPQQ